MKGAVAAGHPLTAIAGLDMLKRGGNAFDAALAATFSSFVCESALTSAGGGGFLMAHSSDGTTLLYDFFPNVPGIGRKCPAKGLHFFPLDVDFTGTTQEFHIGRGSAAVPGSMAGLSEVFKAHCTLPLTTLLKPAISAARNGIKLNAEQARFNRILAPILTATDEGKSVYAPEGRMLEEGETIVKRNLAATLEYLASEGLHQFYKGTIASKILETFGSGGLITAEDLNSYRVHVRRPLEADYRGSVFYTNPPPSSGGCLIAFALKLLERYDLKAMGHNGYHYLSLLQGVMRVADEARGEDFDKKVYDENMEEYFLSAERVDRYSERVGKPSLGEPCGMDSPPGSTTQISVVDKEGNAVSVTTSNGEGCGYMIPGTGVMMNNMLGEEDINPHGFHRQAPGARMSSMMSPTIVMKDGRPQIVLGSGGSNRIRSAVLQVILNILDFDLPVFDAVNAPRVHWDRTAFQLENGIADKTVEQLVRDKVPLNRWDGRNMYFGGVHTVVMGAEKKALSGAGDLRRGGVFMICEE